MGIGFSLWCHRYVFRWLKVTASKESLMASKHKRCMLEWNEAYSLQLAAPCVMIHLIIVISQHQH
jgi:hypothetical protein